MKQPITLVIEDDEDIAAILSHSLLREGFSVRHAPDGSKGLTEALRDDVDLVILDLMLPGMDGTDLLIALREKRDVPLLILSAKDQSAYKIAGLSLGADDYMTKPFVAAELVARVKALLRRSGLRDDIERDEPTCLSWGDDWELRIGSWSLFKRDKEIALSNKEFHLLELFMKNPGRVFTKEQIFRAVWGPDLFFEDNTISVHIRRLREKVEDNPSDPRVITTVWGIGYKMERPS